MKKITHTCSGYCTRCRSVHSLGMGTAKTAAVELIEQLDREKRIDFHVPIEQADSKFSTDYLFGQARGKMFGVLTCQQTDGRLLTVKSYSGQYNGQWEIEGWAPPIFDLPAWQRVNHDMEIEIKILGTKIRAQGKTGPQGKELVEKRKKLSQKLMKELHRLYALHNFRSQCLPLSDIYSGDNGIPNGTADCCGPKLLNFAARNNYRPLGLAEFYYGRQNKQGNRVHGIFYPSCREKCEPIMGFMLCGLNDGERGQQTAP